MINFRGETKDIKTRLAEMELTTVLSKLDRGLDVFFSPESPDHLPKLNNDFLILSIIDALELIKNNPNIILTEYV